MDQLFGKLLGSFLPSRPLVRRQIGDLNAVDVPAVRAAKSFSLKTSGTSCRTFAIILMVRIDKVVACFICS